MKKLKKQIKNKRMKEIKKVAISEGKEKELRIGKDEKERKRILKSFYNKQIKNGKTLGADYSDKIFLMIFTFIFIVFLINKIINNFIISLPIGIGLIFMIVKYSKKKIKHQRRVKIEEIKKSYKMKLEEEGLMNPDDDIEDYIVQSYYKNKKEIKSNINLLGKDKILKLYFLFVIFYIGSYFVSYPIYYKIMAVISFMGASFIGSYNLIEYMKKKDDEDLLNEDFKV